MKKLTQWGRSIEGYCQSKDGRFSICPLYEGTTRAQSYQVRDEKTGRTWTAVADSSGERRSLANCHPTAATRTAASSSLPAAIRRRRDMTTSVQGERRA